MSNDFKISEKRISKEKMKNLYEQDFCLWVEKQANLIRKGQFEQLDLENLLEEIEDMARRYKDALASHLVVLMPHVIKWNIQPQYRSKSWRNSINESRRQIEAIQEHSPSLNENFIHEIWKKCLKRSIQKAEDEIDLKSTVNQLSWQEVFEQEYVFIQEKDKEQNFIN